MPEIPKGFFAKFDRANVKITSAYDFQSLQELGSFCGQLRGHQERLARLHSIIRLGEMPRNSRQFLLTASMYIANWHRIWTVKAGLVGAVRSQQMMRAAQPPTRRHRPLRLLMLCQMRHNLPTFDRYMPNIVKFTFHPVENMVKA
jgi:hypothetical protein